VTGVTGEAVDLRFYGYSREQPSQPILAKNDGHALFTSLQTGCSGWRHP